MPDPTLSPEDAEVIAIIVAVVAALVGAAATQGLNWLKLYVKRTPQTWDDTILAWVLRAVRSTKKEKDVA